MAKKSFNVVDQLAHSLGRRDEVPNIDLSKKIIREKNLAAISELLTLLYHKTAGIRFDAIKVLYEIGERQPELVTPHFKEFFKALDDKDNRMKWGAMCALSAISKAKPELLAPHLSIIVEAMDTGTVITRDHGVFILSQTAALKKYHADSMELLLEQVEKAPVNQMPMYAERTAEVISPPFIKRLVKILHSREDVLEIPSKQKRIEKLLKQLSTK